MDNSYVSLISYGNKVKEKKQFRMSFYINTNFVIVLKKKILLLSNVETRKVFLAWNQSFVTLPLRWL